MEHDLRVFDFCQGSFFKDRAIRRRPHGVRLNLPGGGLEVREKERKELENGQDENTSRDEVSGQIVHKFVRDDLSYRTLSALGQRIKVQFMLCYMGENRQNLGNICPICRLLPSSFLRASFVLNCL